MQSQIEQTNRGSQTISKKPDYIVKCIILGSSNSGKTNFLSRMCHNSYSGLSSRTIGIEFVSKTIKFSEKTINMIFWEVQHSTKNQMKQIFQLCCKGSILIIVMYAINDFQSFSHAQKMVNMIRKLQTTAGLLILANKLDLEEDRRVDKAVGNKLAQQHLTYLKELIEENHEKRLFHKTQSKQPWSHFQQISLKQMTHLNTIFSMINNYIYKQIKGS